MSDHRALIDEARQEHPPSTSQPPHCLGCANDYPCLPARIADALEQESESAKTIERHIPALEAHRDGLLIRAETVERYATELQGAYDTAEHSIEELEQKLSTVSKQWEQSVHGMNDAYAEQGARLSAAERRAAELDEKQGQLKRLYEQCAAQRKDWHARARSAEGKVAALEQRAATADAERDELTGHYEAVRDRVAALAIERAALSRELEAARSAWRGRVDD